MPPCYEYRRATWTEVCALGRDGWRLVPVPPIVEMKQVLGQPQMGEPLYVMERETEAVVFHHGPRPLSETGQRRAAEKIAQERRGASAQS